MNKQIYLLTIVILLLMGCKSATDPPPPEELKELIPLAIGNYWIYEIYMLDSETGEPTGDPKNYSLTGFLVTDTVKLTIDNVIKKSYSISLCRENLETNDFFESKLVENDKYGFNYLGVIKKDSIIIKHNDLIFSSSAKKGETITGHIFYYTTIGNYLNIPFTETTTYSCLSIDSLVVTPAGNFRCAVYKMVYYDIPGLFRNESIFFIKPEIGIVAIYDMTYHYSLKKTRYFMKYVLKKYKLNKEK